jgi:hypothetical protein
MIFCPDVHNKELSLLNHTADGSSISFGIIRSGSGTMPYKEQQTKEMVSSSEAMQVSATIKVTSRHLTDSNHEI